MLAAILMSTSLSQRLKGDSALLCMDRPKQAPQTKKHSAQARSGRAVPSSAPVLDTGEDLSLLWQQPSTKPKPKASPAKYQERSRKAKETPPPWRQANSGHSKKRKADGTGRLRMSLVKRAAAASASTQHQQLEAVAEEAESSSKEVPGQLSLDTLAESMLRNWTANVLQAALLDTTKLPRLLTVAGQHRMTTLVLRSTGAGAVLGADWIWQSLTSWQQKKRAENLKNWRMQIRAETDACRTKWGKVSIPSGLLKSVLLDGGWKAHLTDLRRWLSMLSLGPHEEQECAKLAVKLVVDGFKHMEELEGLPMSAIQSLTKCPKEQAMLTQGIRVIEDLAFAARAAKTRQALGLRSPDKPGPCSAGELADTLSPEALGTLETSCKELETFLGVQLGWENEKDDMKIRQGPRASAVALAEAVSAGRKDEVTRVLQLREDTLRLEAQRKSLPQVAAGLRCWHVFAASVLGYQEAATIPPSCSQDVCAWISIFKCAGTAANYVSHLRWACREHRKGLGWSDEQVSSLLRCLTKRDIRTRLQMLPDKLKIAEEDVHRLIVLAWECGDSLFGCLACLSYHFLLRVASEALPMEVGSLSDAVTRLPEERHSALWSDGTCVHLKLRTRKHRPQGSLMTRHCCCSGEGGDSRLCPVHCLSTAHLDAGAQIFSGWTPSQAVKKLRRYLTLLSVPGAESATLKSFRASRATNLALQGKTVHAVLAAGEWKSAAVLAYANEDAFDRGAILTKTLEESDSEES